MAVCVASAQPLNESVIDAWSRKLMEADVSAVNNPDVDVASSVSAVTELLEESKKALRELRKTDAPDSSGKTVEAGSAAGVVKEKAVAFDAELWTAVQSCCRKLTSQDSDQSDKQDEHYTLFENLAHLYRQHLESLSDVLLNDVQHSDRVLWLAERLSQNASRFSKLVTSKGIFLLFTAGTRCVTSGLLTEASALLSVTLKTYWTWCSSQTVSKTDACRLAYSMVSNAALSFEYQRSFSAAASCRAWLSKVPSQEGDHFHDDAIWSPYRRTVLALLDADKKQLQSGDLVRTARTTLILGCHPNVINQNRKQSLQAGVAILESLEGDQKTFEVIYEYIRKAGDADVEKGPVGSWKENGLDTIHQCMSGLARLSVQCTNLMKKDRAIGAWSLTVTNLNWAAFHQALAKAPRLIQGCPFTISTEEHLQSALNIIDQQSLPMMTPAAIAIAKTKPMLALAKHYFKQENFEKAKALAETALSTQSTYCPSGRRVAVVRESLTLLLNVALQRGDDANVQYYCSQVDQLPDAHAREQSLA